MFKKYFKYFGPMFEEDSGTSSGGAPSAPSEGTPPGGTEGTGGGSQGEPTADGSQSTDPTPGGEKTFTQSQVEGMIRARIAEAKQSFDGKYADADKNRGLVDRIAQMTGISADQLEAQLEAVEAQAVAQQTGMAPQVYQAMKGQQAQIDKLSKDALSYKLDAEEAQLKTNPLYKSALDNEDIRTEIREFATNNNLSIQQAFWATQGSKGTEQMERDIEARIMASIQNKMGKGPVLSDADGGLVDKTFGLSPEEIDFYSSRGDDLEDMAALKSMNNIDAYRAHKAKKAKK